MEKEIFRKKSLERVSSPEQLNDYIRVSNPSVWIILIAVIVLLAGVCVWGVFGRLETRLSAAAVAEGGTVVCYVRESEIGRVETGMEVSAGGQTLSVKEIAAQPVAVDASFGVYFLYVGGLQIGEWVYAVTLEGTLADGVYAAEIVVDSVSPMSFVLN